MSHNPHHNNPAAELTSNKLYLDMYQALQDPDIRTVLEVPMLVLVAGQSAGKSFLISHIAQYLITYMDSSVGTRCPVRYDFRNADNVGRTEVSVDKVHCELWDVARLVRDAMENVKRSSPTQFSNREIEVIICIPGAQNIIIVDMPGFPDSGRPHYAQTKGLIVDMLTANPKAIIVAVVDASVVDSANRGNTAGFEDVLRDVRPDWREGTIFVNNKINVALPYISTTHELVNFFKPVDGKDEYYVILHPASGARGARDIHSMSTDEVSAYIKDTRAAGEEAALTGLLQDVLDKQNSPHIDAAQYIASLREKFKFGVSALEHGLHERVHKEILSQLPLITNSLGSRRELATKEVERMTVEADLGDPMKIRDLYNQYITRITQVIRAVLAHECHDVEGLEVAKYAMLFKDELRAAHDGARDELPLLYETLIETLGHYRESRTSLKKMVEEMRLGGYPAGYRMLLVYGLQILSTPHEPPSAADTFGAAISPVSGNVGEANFNRMVMQDVRPNVGKLKKHTPWLKNHLSFLLKRMYTCAQDHIHKNEPYYAPIRHHRVFHDMLFKKYMEVVTSRSEAIGSMVNDMISDHQTIFSLDSSYRSIPMMALAPNGDLAQDILPSTTTAPPVQAPPPAAPVANNADDAGEHGNGEDTEDEFVDAPARAAPVNAPQYRGLVGLNGPIHPLPAHILRAIDASGRTAVTKSVSTIINTVQTSRHSFDIVDILKLDIEHYPNLPMFDLSMDKTTMIAQRQFFFVKTELYKSVERAVQAQFVYFSNHYLPDFNKKLSEALSRYSNDDLYTCSGYELAKMEELKVRLASETRLVEKLTALETSLQTFYHAHIRTPKAFEHGGSLGITVPAPNSAHNHGHQSGANGHNNANNANNRKGKRGGGNGNGNGNYTGAGGAGGGSNSPTRESVLSDPNVSGEEETI